MKKSCRECEHHNPKMVEKVDAQWKHPFTCICTGPSGSGKSTLVKKLILSQGKIIDSFFDYIIIVIGTEASENKILSSIVKEIPLGRTDVHIMELNKLYPMRRDMVEEFPKQLKKILINRNRKGHKGCIIFDDLMKELGEMGILLDLFTKMSLHYSFSHHSEPFSQRCGEIFMQPCWNLPEFKNYNTFSQSSQQQSSMDGGK